MNTEEIFQQVMNENCKNPLHRFAELVRQEEREASDTLKKLAGEALTALEKYNRYEIKTDSYDHSTNLIYDLRDVLNHKRMPLREWVGLTDEEIDYIWGISPPDYEKFFDFPRAIEAKLKEKNT
jgi:hypothetical protein